MKDYLKRLSTAALQRLQSRVLDVSDLKTYKITLLELDRYIKLRGPTTIHGVQLSSLTFVHIQLTSIDAILLRRQGFCIRDVGA